MVIYDAVTADNVKSTNKINFARAHSLQLCQFCPISSVISGMNRGQLTLQMQLLVGEGKVWKTVLLLASTGLSQSLCHVTTLLFPSFETDVLT